MKIAWSVKLPKDAKLKVKDGNSVKAGDLIYEYHENIIERLPLSLWQNLNSSERKVILGEIIKKDLVAGQIIGKSGWFSKNIIKSPGSGKCMGVDEFGNIELEKEVDEKYLSPVSANKIRIEDDKVVFELKGIEFEGEGINQYKAWGDFDGLVVDDLGQIDSQQNKEIVIVKDNIDVAIKAEAVGAVGLIVVNIEKLKELEDSDVPIVVMKEDDVTKMIKFIDGKQVKIWLNASAGRVLCVLLE